MVGQLRLALLIGAITAVAVSPARANFRAPRSGCCDPCGTSVATAPAFRTITCTEWVRETYQVKRTAYKVECRTEVYDACKYECFPVIKEQVVCVTKKVPVVTEQIVKVCKKVTTYVDKPVTTNTYKYVQETCIKKQLVRLGHWECREVAPLFGSLFHGHGDCCNPCPAPCRTKKVWVCCKEYKECPYTVCKKICVPVTTICKVPVCSNVYVEEKVKVCSYTCVTEKIVQKCTVYERRPVTYKATKTVRVCVPYETLVTCCKLVPRTVTRQVPCAPVCAPACTPATTCGDTCSTHCGLFSRLGSYRLRCNADCCR